MREPVGPLCLLAAVLAGQVSWAGPLEDLEGRAPSSPAGDPPPFFAPFGDQFVTTGSFNTLHHYFRATGTGGVLGKFDIPGLNTAAGIDVADMDGDGDNDFVVCEGTGIFADARVFLYTKQSSGTFDPSPVAVIPAVIAFYCTNLRIADFNSDGAEDFVAGDPYNNEGMRVYFQSTPGSFELGAVLDTAWASQGGVKLFGVATGDLNGDDNVDVVVLGYGVAEVHWNAGNGAGGFAASAELFDLGSDFGVGFPTGAACFDLEGDGDPDLVVGGGTDGAHYVYTNDGAGHFTKPAGPAFDLDAATGIDAWDADGDGDDDLMIVTSDGQTAGRLLFAENVGGALVPPIVVAVTDLPSLGIGAPAEPFAPACGDGVLQPGEECDDGNVLDGDGCPADCGVAVVPALDGWGLSIATALILVASSGILLRRR